MTELTGRQDAPVLLVTKLHPPFVPAQTVARERLFERLRDGRGRRLTLVACPAGFGKSTLLAAWRESELAHRPVAWVTLDEGDDDPVVLWSHVIAALCRACPGLATGARRGGRRRAAARGRAAAAGQRAGRAGRRRARARRLPPAVERDRARERRVVRRAPAGDASSSCSRPAPTRRSRSARCGPAASCSSCGPTSCASRRRGRRVPQRAARAGARRRRRRAARRPHRGLAGRHLPRRAVAGRHGGQARRSSRAFDGTSAHVVDFLATEVLAGLRARAAAFMLRTSVLERLCAPLCDAVVGEPVSAAALESLARTNLFLLPLDDRRRWFRFHHLFAQLLRVELERREPRARAASCTAARTRGTASTARPTRRSTTRSRRGAYAEASRADRRDLGALRQRRPHVVGPRLAAAHPRRGARRRPAAAARRARGSRRCAGSEGDMRAALARVRELGGLDDGPLPGRLRLGRVQPLGAERRVRLGRRAGDARAGARSAELEGPDSPWRPVVTWALGWAHYCNGDLDQAERWLEETRGARARRRAVDRRRRGRSPTCR